MPVQTEMRQPSSPNRRERMTAMQRTSAAVGTSIFFVLAPGTIAGLIPWSLTGWHPHHTQASAWIPFRVLGAALIAAALPVLVAAFVRFAKEGIGTPAPIAPTEHLVVGGLYRYVRNPIFHAPRPTSDAAAWMVAAPRVRHQSEPGTRVQSPRRRTRQCAWHHQAPA